MKRRNARTYLARLIGNINGTGHSLESREIAPGELSSSRERERDSDREPPEERERERDAHAQDDFLIASFRWLPLSTLSRWFLAR